MFSLFFLIFFLNVVWQATDLQMRLLLFLACFFVAKSLAGSVTAFFGACTGTPSSGSTTCSGTGVFPCGTDAVTACDSTTKDGNVWYCTSGSLTGALYICQSLTWKSVTGGGGTGSSGGLGGSGGTGNTFVDSVGFVKTENFVQGQQEEAEAVEQVALPAQQEPQGHLELRDLQV